jgi:hypothetical protein
MTNYAKYFRDSTAEPVDTIGTAAWEGSRASFSEAGGTLPLSYVFPGKFFGFMELRRRIRAKFFIPWNSCSNILISNGLRNSARRGRGDDVPAFVSIF